MEARHEVACFPVTRVILPFDLKGIDSDNRSEFINNDLYAYCQEKRIQFTRGGGTKGRECPCGAEELDARPEAPGLPISP